MSGSSRRARWRPFLLVAVWLTWLGPASAAAATPPAPGHPDSIPPDSLVAAPDSAGAHGALVDSTALHRASESLMAKGTSATPETLATTQTISVPVFLGGKEIFRVRSSRDGLAPAARAAAIRARLTGAVADTKVPADSVRLLATSEGVEVRIGRHFLWVITPADVEGTSPAELAARMAELPDLVRGGIEKERAGRRPLGILFSVLIALGITLVASVLARFLLIGARRWRAWLVEFLPRRLRGIQLPELRGAVAGPGRRGRRRHPGPARPARRRGAALRLPDPALLAVPVDAGLELAAAPLRRRQDRRGRAVRRRRVAGALHDRRDRAGVPVADGRCWAGSSTRSRRGPINCPASTPNSPVRASGWSGSSCGSPP